MNTPPHDTASDAAVDAYTRVNSMVLQRLQAKLQNPAVDLSDFLRQQADTYPQLRSAMAKGAISMAAAATDTSRTDDADADADDESSSGGLPRSLLIHDGDVDVVHPLDDALLVHVGVVKQGGASTAQTVALLNQAMRGGSVLWELDPVYVVALGSAAVVKTGRLPLDPDEAANLVHVQQHAAAMPAPRCLGSLVSQGRSYLFMTRAAGTTLETVWPQLAEAQKRSVQAQLDGFFAVFRALPVPASAGIGSFGSGTCKDKRRMPRTCDKKHLTEAAWNDFLCSDPQRQQTPWIRLIRSLMRDDHRIVWTHGDLHPRNIMVQWATAENDGAEAEADAAARGIRVTAVIDWQTAGWYPESWEFCKALSTLSRAGPLSDWCNYLPLTLGRWPAEYALDCLIDRWLG